MGNARNLKKTGPFETEGAEKIRSHFKEVRREGNQWKALCPAHADKNPSLSIRNVGAKVLLHCFAGCSLEAVLDAAGIEVRDLFADDAERRGVVAEYDYTNERGEILYQVVRSVPKSFRQRRPDGQGGLDLEYRGCA